MPRPKGSKNKSTLEREAAGAGAAATATSSTPTPPAAPPPAEVVSITSPRVDAIRAAREKEEADKAKKEAVAKEKEAADATTLENQTIERKAGDVWDGPKLRSRIVGIDREELECDIDPGLHAGHVDQLTQAIDEEDLLEAERSAVLAELNEKKKAIKKKIREMKQKVHRHTELRIVKVERIASYETDMMLFRRQDTSAYLESKSRRLLPEERQSALPKMERTKVNTPKPPAEKPDAAPPAATNGAAGHETPTAQAGPTPGSVEWVKAKLPGFEHKPEDEAFWIDLFTKAINLLQHGDHQRVPPILTEKEISDILDRGNNKLAQKRLAEEAAKPPTPTSSDGGTVPKVKLKFESQTDDPSVCKHCHASEFDHETDGTCPRPPIPT